MKLLKYFTELRQQNSKFNPLKMSQKHTHDCSNALRVAPYPRPDFQLLHRNADRKTPLAARNSKSLNMRYTFSVLIGNGSVRSNIGRCYLSESTGP